MIEFEILKVAQNIMMLPNLHTSIEIIKAEIVLMP